MKIKFHAIRQFQQEVEPSKEQITDLFTKSLAKERFEELREMIGMNNLESRRSVEK